MVGVDLRALAGEHPQAQAAGGQVLHGVDQVARLRPRRSPDEHVTLAPGAQAVVESRPVVAYTGGEVVVEVRVVDASVTQSVALQVQRLRAVRLRGIRECDETPFETERSETDTRSDPQVAEQRKQPRAILHAPKEPGSQGEIHSHSVQRQADVAHLPRPAGALEPRREVHACTVLRPVIRRHRDAPASRAALPRTSDQQVSCFYRASGTAT